MIRGIDKHITGGNYSSLGAVPHVCINGHVWTALMFTEYGGDFYHNDDEIVCSVCKESGATQDQIDNMHKALKNNASGLKAYFRGLQYMDDKALIKLRNTLQKTDAKDILQLADITQDQALQAITGILEVRAENRELPLTID